MKQFFESILKKIQAGLGFNINSGKKSIIYPDPIITDPQELANVNSGINDHYISVFAQSTDAYLLLANSFIDCNEKACELFGCKAADLIGHTPYEFSPKIQPDGKKSELAAKEKIEKALIEGTQQFYWKHKRKDGSLFDAEVTLKIISIKGRNVLFATVKDITEILKIKRTEEKLLKETRIINESILLLDQFKGIDQIFEYLGNTVCSLIENSYVVINRYSHQNNGKLKIFKIFSPEGDHKIETVLKKSNIDIYNKEFDIPTYDQEEFRKFSSAKLVELPNGIEQAVSGSISKFHIKIIESYLGVKKVYAMGFTKNAKLFGSLAILRKEKHEPEHIRAVETIVNHALTVIHKKVAIKALRESGKKYRVIAENSNDVIWVLTKDKKISYVSPSVERITGFNTREFKNLSLREILSTESLQKLNLHIDNFIHPSTKSIKYDLPSSVTLELDFRHRTRGFITTEAIIKTIFDKNNNITGFHSISRDISKRKVIEEQLKQVEERNTSLINNLPSGLAIFSASLNILFANPTFFNLLKYDTVAVKPFNILSQFELFGMHEVLQHIKRLTQESQPFDIEVLAHEHNNEKYYLRIRGYTFPSYSQEQQAFMLLISNISERKTAIDKLGEREQRFKDIYSQSPIGIELYDEPGYLIDSNPAAMQIYGIDNRSESRNTNLFKNPDIPSWAKDQLILGNTTRFRTSIDFEKIKSEWGFRTLKSGITYLDVMAAPLKSGSKIHGFILQFMNITEQVMAEEVIEKLRMAFEQTMDGIVMTNLEGDIQFVNKAWANQHGYEEDELIGMNISHFQTENNLFVNNLIFYKAVIASGFEEIELEHKRKDGSTIFLKITGTLMKDSLGNPIGIIEITSNVTEEKKEQQLRTALFQISESLYNAGNINELYIAIYNIIRKLMPAKNFYIANYDSENDIVSFPFFVDEHDQVPSTRKSGNGLTEYVIKTGNSMLVSPEKFEELSIEFEIESFGRQPVDWLGVPLKSSGRVIGLMAVQTYDEGIRFTENDKYILDFISSQVVLAIERKNAESYIRESESKFRTLTETLSVGVFIHNSETIIYANPAFESLTGYKPEDLIQNKFISFVAPDFRSEFEIAFSKHISNNIPEQRLEFQLITKNNELKWVDYYSSLIEFEGKIAILATISDQTERKLTEDRLRLAKLMIENSPNIIFRLKTDEEWTVDFVSENITRFEYLPVEFLSGLVTFKSIIYPDDRKKVADLLSKEIKNKNDKFSIQFRILTKTNQIKWIENFFALQFGENNEIINYQCVVQDITEKKAAEDALRTTEEMLKKLIENSDYLVILQDLSGKYIYFNGLHQYDTSGTQLIGKHPSDVLEIEASNEIMNRIANVINTGQVVNAENKIHWQGRELWFLDHSYPVHDLDGKVIAVGTISVDITERKNFELKIIESERKLREASVTKERIFSIIRHDIMGPLGALKNLTEMIYRKPQIFDANESKDMMKAIMESSTSVYELISTLISWAKSQNGDALYHPLNHSVNEVVNECIQLLSPTAIQKNIKLVSDISGELSGYFDKIMITTVVRNLISNALKFTQENGEVIVEAKSDQEFITISVKDNGTGIKPENTNKLFDIDFKFSTAGTNNEKGTGLGLNLCRNFITRNGGEIWLQSEWGKGSTFYFTLPLLKENIKLAKPVLEADEEVNFADKVILLVDDEFINLKVIEEYLSPTHARLIYARDGNEAIRIFKEEDKIDLILMDLLMPELDGFEATAQIRKLNTSIPIIAQTSYDLDEHKKRFKQSGGTDYLVKPIIRKSLYNMLKNHF